MIDLSRRRFAVADLVRAEGSGSNGLYSLFRQRKSGYSGGLFVTQTCLGAAKSTELAPNWHSTRKETWQECRDEHGTLKARELFSPEVGFVTQVEYPNGSKAVAEHIKLKIPDPDLFFPPEDFQEVPIEDILQTLTINRDVVL